MLQIGCARAGHFDQNIHLMDAFKRLFSARNSFDMPLDISPRHELKGFYSASRFILQPVEQRQRIFQLAQPDHGRNIGQRLPIKTQNRSCNNAQSSFSADEQMFEIKASVILAQF